MIGHHHDSSVIPEVLLIECIEHPAEVVIDHRKLGPVICPDLTARSFVGHRWAVGVGIGGPDDLRALPVGVVHRSPGLGRIERLVWIELVDEKEETVVLVRVGAEPRRRSAHRLRAGKILLGSKIGSRALIAAIKRCGLRLERGRSEPRWIEARLPRVVLVPAHVRPSREIGVVVLASRFEQMGMIGDKLGYDALAAKVVGDRVLPDLH